MYYNYDFGRVGITERSKEEYQEILNTQLNHFVESKFVSMDKVSIEVEYNLDGLYTYQDLANTSTIFKLQCIKSLIDLVLESNSLLGIDLDKENLYFSSNSHAYQLVRTLDQARLTEAEYLTIVKSFLGDLFMKEDFASILSSEGTLLRKNKLLAGFATLSSFDEFKRAIDETIKKEQEIELVDLIQVEKDFVKNNKVKHRIKNLSIFALLFFLVFFLFIFIPNRTSQLAAITSYEDKVYEDVVHDLSNTNINSMSPVIKYIMSESTIRLADLSDTQKNNILYNLSPSVDENILDYWVYVGQEDYEAAYNQAITNNDAQQKAYVLLLLIDQTQNDTSLDNDEKESLLSVYEGELDSIVASMQEGEE